MFAARLHYNAWSASSGSFPALMRHGCHTWQGFHAEAKHMLRLFQDMHLLCCTEEPARWRPTDACLQHHHSVSLPVQEVVETKQFLAVQSFTNKTAFRHKLMVECQATLNYGAECQHFSPGAAGRTSFPYGQIQQAATQSWFCLQPAGDTPTRAATFDCLIILTVTALRTH